MLNGGSFSTSCMKLHEVKSEPQNRRMSNVECRRAESLRSVFSKIDRIHYFDIRFFRVSLSIWPAVFLAGGWAEPLNPWTSEPLNLWTLEPLNLPTQTDRISIFFCNPAVYQGLRSFLSDEWRGLNIIGNIKKISNIRVQIARRRRSMRTICKLAEFPSGSELSIFCDNVCYK